MRVERQVRTDRRLLRRWATRSVRVPLSDHFALVVDIVSAGSSIGRSSSASGKRGRSMDDEDTGPTVAPRIY